MQRKEETLRDLGRVKLIVGNGFDLYCGLKTSYRDYFGYYRQRYELIYKWIDETADYVSRNPVFHLSVPAFSEDKPTFNCWDAFFVLFFEKDRDYFWCDVEKGILESLTSKDAKRPQEDYKPHWEDVFELLSGDDFKKHGPGSAILAFLILQKTGFPFKTKEAFYEYLLSELKEFELAFGRYITKQHVAYNGFFCIFNDSYVGNAHRLLTSLCNVDEIVSIDCFNYGFTPESSFYPKCKFINGNWRNPIFGIDSIFEPDDPRYVFTKTNRRIEMDMNRNVTDEYQKYDNAIVFGHSLNEHDYSYFFPILDQLEMTNHLAAKRLVVAYSVYDQTKEEAIKKSIRAAIYRLFTAYAHYRVAPGSETRLLDSLTTQGRVLTIGLPPLSIDSGDFAQRGIDITPQDAPVSTIDSYWSNYIEHGSKLRFL